MQRPRQRGDNPIVFFDVSIERLKTSADFVLVRRGRLEQGDDVTTQNVLFTASSKTNSASQETTLIMTDLVVRARSAIVRVKLIRS
ncbi:hypothetical protein PF005_g21532 [Phytophthora fragariae]|uniref:Uncharacterized protein n=1 Tax=Phytophthora fragariae TaxID=53985 RepID=A0A6A4CD34_9STRA|nr:hypothetical protein PF009_g17415 [Phytophthora fragariae]KAE8982628.1 hypothetical protein PF011_g21536 [Phytophthora fragariae]KAE9082764.1 hypothetical protein PF010_g21459 [Phytophthora fragariae]KAE9084494.1 hypothetical protein PF007_g21497 [Phytophthora fragariae]KAE9106910.1 hypothetical protein PF006_g21248 [Phytophthora fragariae]